MFTGIIESLGEITAIEKEGENYHFTIESEISKELKIDQSVAHNGVCLTVVEKTKKNHVVTAIHETVQKTNFGFFIFLSLLNLERCLKIGGRLDGHMVQGHVDGTVKCVKIANENGSWRYYFEGANIDPKLIVNKGSICINGVSLTIANIKGKAFEVAIIPYTYENTNFKDLKANDLINIEYDILGKYILKNLKT